MKKYLLLALAIIMVAALVLAVWFFFLRGETGREAGGGARGAWEAIDLGHGFSYYETGSSYEAASGGTQGAFQSGQQADILLSGVDFNDTGGSLFFNHPGNVASDGVRLVLADRNNNRVLIWNSLPTGNQEPDLVLGQKNFTTNDPGSGLEGMNWPVGVATDGTCLLVADTYNDRILVWNKFPTSSGQAADYAIGKLDDLPPMDDNSKSVSWPWAVWTDGERLIVTSTGGGRVLIWNRFPPDGKTPPDIILRLKGKFGTPRSIGCDGKHLLIGDHNAYGKERGNFFWQSFPTRNNQEPDFFMASMAPPPPQPTQPGQQPGAGTSPPVGDGVTTPPPQAVPLGEIFWGPVFTDDGRLLVLGGNNNIGVWDEFPEDGNDYPDLVVGRIPGPGPGRGPGTQSGEGYDFKGGDGSSMALAGERLYISLCNSNKIVGFDSLPDSTWEEPDFAVGSPDIYTNTLETEFIMSNPNPVSDGDHLYVSSDFDRKLYVYRHIPDQSGAKPDLVYNLPNEPWDNALHGDVLALAGKRSVYVWNTLPLEPRLPDIILEEKIGNVNLQEVKGVALDDKYFYLADKGAGMIYIWEGLPNSDSDPVLTLGSCNGVTRLSSDGTYLAATFTEVPGGGDVRLYRVAELGSGGQPISLTQTTHMNLPEGATVAGGILFVCDTINNRVLIWDNVENALQGRKPDATLGNQEEILPHEIPEPPRIGRADLFWPATASYDGAYLWLGEYKFSERLLRFSPR